MPQVFKHSAISFFLLKNLQKSLQSTDNFVFLVLNRAQNSLFLLSFPLFLCFSGIFLPVLSATKELPLSLFLLISVAKNTF